MIDYLINLPVEQKVIYILLLIVLFIQFYYYLYIYLKPVLWKYKDKPKTTDPISVIICARNEYDNLKKHLPIILEQEYPKYEVIVVNDCSADDTEMLLGELEQKYKHLRHTTIEQDEKFSHGKKLAITIGIKAAKHDKLVFTDADCYPVSKLWLKEMAILYSDNTQIVLGYGGYENKKGLLNKIIRFDTLLIAMQYLGFAIIGKPYMGVGRNLSYKKSLFFQNKGFSKHYGIPSGDDDLFVNENANKNNCTVTLSKTSFTRSVPQTSWRRWAKQKKRHLTTGHLYKKNHRFFIGLEPFSRMLFYSFLIILVIFETNLYILSGFYILRLLIQMITIKVNMQKFDEKGFWLLTPFLDILMPFIYILFILGNKLNARNNKWR